MALDNNRLGAYVGSLVGICGWVLGLIVVAVAYRAWGLLLPMVVPGLVLSLARGLLLVVAHDALSRVYGARHGRTRQALWGMLATLIGTLWLLVNHWVAPALEAAVGEAGLPRTVVVRTPDVWPALVLAGGAVLLARLAWQQLHDPLPPQPASDRPAAPATARGTAHS